MANFKVLQKVVSKYSDWEGYIDTITPNGQILVRTPGSYEWVNPSQIIPKEDAENIKVKKKRDLSFFQG